jgi:hypothetical protein
MPREECAAGAGENSSPVRFQARRRSSRSNGKRRKQGVRERQVAGTNEAPCSPTHSDTSWKVRRSFGRLATRLNLQIFDPHTETFAQKKPPGGKHRAAPLCLRGDEELRQRWLCKTMARRRIRAHHPSRTVRQSGPTHQQADWLRPRYGGWAAPASSPDANMDQACILRR